MCERLAVRPGETTEDGAVSLEFAECLGACDLAPAMLAGDELIGNLTREKIDAFVAGLRRRTWFAGVGGMIPAV